MISIPSDEGRGSANASPACSLAITERGAKSVGESTPLLKERSGGSVQVFAPDSPPLDLSLRGEIQQWFIQSLPVVVATTCRVGLSVIDTGFLGHLSTEALAAASIASTIMFIMMNGISGAAACINALGAQCYGAGNKKLVGVWLQISVVVCSVAAVPAIVLFMFIDPMLAPIIPEAEVRQLAGEFARWSSLSIWPAAMYCAIRQFFQVQNVLLPATVVALLAIGVNIGCNQLFIHGSGTFDGFGFIGSPLATATSFFFQLFAFWLYTWAIRRLHLDCWPGWSLSHWSRKRLKRFLRFAGPAVITGILEEGAFQGLMLLSGRMSPTDAAAFGILGNIWALVWGAVWGGALATEIRVAFHLGGGRAGAAVRSLRLGVVLTLAMVALPAILTNVFRHRLATPFSDDPAVMALVGECAPLLTLCFCSHALKMTLGQSVEGSGKPKTLTAITIIGTWGVTLPFALLLSFTYGQGLRGLWQAPILGELTQALLHFIVLLRTDWRAMAKNARLLAEVPPTKGEGPTAG